MVEGDKSELWEEFDSLSSPWGIQKSQSGLLSQNDSDDEMSQELDLSRKLYRSGMLLDISLSVERIWNISEIESRLVASLLSCSDADNNSYLNISNSNLYDESAVMRSSISSRPSADSSNPSNVADFHECTDEVVLSWYVLSNLYAGLEPTSLNRSSNEELRCSYMLECSVHAFANSCIIMNIISKIATIHNLHPRRCRGGQILLSVSRKAFSRRDSFSEGIHAIKENQLDSGWGDWSFVDTQLVISKATKNRMLLIRLLLSLDSESKCKTVKLGSESPLAESFVNSMKEELVNNRLLNNSLASKNPSFKDIQLPELDQQFCQQMENECRAELERNILNFRTELEEYMRREESMYLSAARLLRSMFHRYNIPFPNHFICQCSSPVVSSIIQFKGLTASDREELQCISYQTEGERALACIYVTWRRYVEQCDTQMSRLVDIMTKKVLEQLLEYKLFIQEIIQILSDETTSHYALNASKAFHRVLAESSDGKFSSNNMEVPMFYCSVFFGGWPGTMYLTYRMLYLVGAFPGFPGNISKVFFSDVVHVDLVPRRWSKDSIQIQQRDGTIYEVVPVISKSACLRDLLAAAIEVYRDGKSKDNSDFLTSS